MEFRQRHYNKTLEMTNQYMKHFKVPASWQGASKEESFAKWKRYLYLNHVQQAMCIDTAFSYWRRLRCAARAAASWTAKAPWRGGAWGKGERPVAPRRRRLGAVGRLAMRQLRAPRTSR